MDRCPPTCHDGWPVQRAHRLFAALGLRHLVVVGSQMQPVGMLTRHDLQPGRSLARRRELLRGSGLQLWPHRNPPVQHSTHDPRCSGSEGWPGVETAAQRAALSDAAAAGSPAAAGSALSAEWEPAGGAAAHTSTTGAVLDGGRGRGGCCASAPTTPLAHGRARPAVEAAPPAFPPPERNRARSSEEPTIATNRSLDLVSLDRRLDRFLPRSSATVDSSLDSVFEESLHASHRGGLHTEEVFEESLRSSRSSHREQEAAIDPPTTRMAPRTLLAPLLAQPAAEREAHASLPNQGGPMWLRMLTTVKEALLARA